MRGKGVPWYGKLNTRELPFTVHKIWLTREHEPEECPPSMFFSHDYIDDPCARYERVQLCQAIFNEAFNRQDVAERFERRCQAMVMHYMEDYTLEEVGQRMGITRERARQLANSGLRLMQRAIWRNKDLR